MTAWVDVLVATFQRPATLAETLTSLCAQTLRGFNLIISDQSDAPYNAEKLRAAGGFEFWRELPPDHCGEDVVAQIRVMARDGGCGIIPSGVYHQERPTTIVDRRVDAPHVLNLDPGARSGAR